MLSQEPDSNCGGDSELFLRYETQRYRVPDLPDSQSYKLDVDGLYGRKKDQDRRKQFAGKRDFLCGACNW